MWTVQALTLALSVPRPSAPCAAPAHPIFRPRSTHAPLLSHIMLWNLHVSEKLAVLVIQFQCIGIGPTSE